MFGTPKLAIIFYRRNYCTHAYYAMLHISLYYLVFYVDHFITDV